MKEVSVINIEEEADWLHGPPKESEKPQKCADRKSFKTQDGSSCDTRAAGGKLPTDSEHESASHTGSDE
jgi:hypothetical protein